jgi:tRNA(Ile2) C34 agmatinyltransferase TiaS
MTPPNCPQCDGDGTFLGTLGNNDQFRCRHCGWDYSRPVSQRDEPDQDDE